MSGDNLPTVWAAEDHTLAKHAILKHFLGAWLAILTRQANKLGGVASNQILYIDGFAGPGEYSGGEVGSPLMALDVALSHSLPRPVHFVFIEQREDRFEHLRSVVRRYEDRINKSANVILEPLKRGDCDSVLSGILGEYASEGLNFGPALAFLDQFGYSAVSMELITKLMRFPQCETFSYLDCKDMNRWIGDPTKEEAFTRAFGSEDWRGAIARPHDRQAFLLETYKKNLQDIAKVRYVSYFSMADKSGNPLYWLFFCTNHLRGLEEMKKAMWKVDETGNFRFSDKDDPNQLRLLADFFTQQWLASEIEQHFNEKAVTVEDVRHYVLEHTPCCLYKGALGILEKNRCLVRLDGPARGFSDGKMTIEFKKQGLF